MLPILGGAQHFEPCDEVVGGGPRLWLPLGRVADGGGERRVGRQDRPELALLHPSQEARPVVGGVVRRGVPAPYDAVSSAPSAYALRVVAKKHARPPTGGCAADHAAHAARVGASAPAARTTVPTRDSSVGAASGGLSLTVPTMCAASANTGCELTRTWRPPPTAA